MYIELDSNMHKWANEPIWKNRLKSDFSLQFKELFLIKSSICETQINNIYSHNMYELGYL